MNTGTNRNTRTRYPFLAPALPNSSAKPHGPPRPRRCAQRAHHVTHRGNRRAFIFLRDEDQQAVDAIRARARTGKPCDDKAFVQRISELCGRDLEPQPPGRKPAAGTDLPGQGDLFDE